MKIQLSMTELRKLDDCGKFKTYLKEALQNWLVVITKARDVDHGKS